MYLFSRSFLGPVKRHKIIIVYFQVASEFGDVLGTVSDADDRLPEVVRNLGLLSVRLLTLYDTDSQIF